MYFPRQILLVNELLENYFVEVALDHFKVYLVLNVAIRHEVTRVRYTEVLIAVYDRFWVTTDIDIGNKRLAYEIDVHDRRIHNDLSGALVGCKLPVSVHGQRTRVFKGLVSNV